MQNRFGNILAFYEDLRLHHGSLWGKEGAFTYQSPSSLHSSVTSFAYGIREVRNCFSAERYPCISKVLLEPQDLCRRFYVKLKACLFNWKRYVAPISITVNGSVAYSNDAEFFENVNLGWPTVYIPIPNTLLKEGENIIEIAEGEAAKTALLITTVDLLSLPPMQEGQQLTALSAARLGDTVALSFFAEAEKISVLSEKECSVLGIAPSPINSEQTIIRLKIEGYSPSLELTVGEKTVSALLPDIYPESQDRCLVGTDSDDHRHDDSDETDRILEIFTNTALGNFWQARPQFRRNYYNSSPQEKWEKRIQYLKSFGTKISLSDGNKVMQYLPALCGDSFVGSHFHEAYLYFCSALIYNKTLSEIFYLDPEKLLASESFGESKKMFEEALKKMYEGNRGTPGLTSVGSPSLLTCYEATSGFERITVEPVSNINLLIGAVRGAAPKMWGAHVPTDWYFGEPNDRTKAKKFLLAMQLLYINGADYIYAENSLFKTNAFSREDWEDEFCTHCRKYLREFYEYTIKEPRRDSLKTDLCLLYGNHEYFLWHHDDRIAELPENDDWDITVWGKWRENDHIKCWRSADAWLPLASDQNTRENILNPKLFSGTPYGSVDVVSYESDWQKYKAVALLGWNTYEEGFSDKLLGYVKNGGQALISFCHLNMTDRSDRPMEYAEASSLGIKVDGIYRYIGTVYLKDGQTLNLESEIPLAKCSSDGAQVIAWDERKNPLILKKDIGKGSLYFCSFADYSCPDERLHVTKYALELIGKSVAEVECTNPDICFTRRVSKEGSTTIDLVDLRANSEEPSDFELIFKNGTHYSGKAYPCEIQKIVF